MKNFICYKNENTKKIFLEEYTEEKLQKLLNKTDNEIIAIRYNGKFDFNGYEIEIIGEKEK